MRRIGHHGFFSERHRDSLWWPVLEPAGRAPCLGRGRVAWRRRRAAPHAARERDGDEHHHGAEDLHRRQTFPSSSHAYAAAAMTCAYNPTAPNVAGSFAKAKVMSPCPSTCAVTVHPTSSHQPGAVTGRNFCSSASGSRITVNTAVLASMTMPVPWCARRRETTMR